MLNASTLPRVRATQYIDELLLDVNANPAGNNAL
jgi:hypothetical protein